MSFSFYVSFLSHMLDELNKLASAPNVWVFRTWLVEHCSTNTEDTGHRFESCWSPQNLFSGLIRNYLFCNNNCDGHSLISSNDYCLWPQLWHAQQCDDGNTVIVSRKLKKLGHTYQVFPFTLKTRAKNGDFFVLPSRKIPCQCAIAPSNLGGGSHTLMLTKG